MPLKLLQTNLVGCPQKHQERGSTECSKPRGLKPSRCDAKLYAGALLVPDTIVVGRHDAKLIAARTQTTIKRLTTCAGVLPGRVLAFELVAESNLARIDQTQRRIVDAKFMRQRRDFHCGLTDAIVLAVRGDVLDNSGRFYFVMSKPARIDDTQPRQLDEEQAVICCLDDLRSVVARLESLFDAVCPVKNTDDFDLHLGIVGPSVQCGFGHADQATGHQQPNVSLRVVSFPKHVIARQASVSVEKGNIAIFDAGQPALRCSPNRAAGVSLNVGDLPLKSLLRPVLL